MGLDNLKKAEEILNSIFVERREEIHALTLAVLSGTHMLLLGPPGTAKSDIVMTWSKLIHGAKYFQWMLTKYSTPDELAGQYSLKALDEDRYSRNTTGKLPEAHFAFIDEIWKGNAGVLNFMLTLLNERIFYNDGQAVKTPLISMVGASNELPEDGDGLDAMVDRFSFKFDIKRVQEPSNFIKILTTSRPSLEPLVTLDEISTMQKEVNSVHVPDAINIIYSGLRSKFILDGITASERSYVQSYKILKAEAYYQGRKEVREEDFDILQHTLWRKPEEKKIIYSTILNSVNPELNEATEIFDRAAELYTQLLKDVKDVSINEKKKTAGGVEAVVKLKKAKTDLGSLKQAVQRKGKDITKIRELEKKVEEYLVSVYSEACGVDF